MSATPDESPPPLVIDPFTLHTALSRGDEIVLLDCRETRERTIAVIEPSLFIPMMETPQRLSELEPHREQNLVVYCHAGVRSFQVAQYLRSQGFPNAQSLDQGIEGWSLHIDPQVPRY